ncbi:hypothetical protein TNCV_1970611 [Trichonephila clavipes]|uniref:Uncharacterized protein n=1 Tax=Trichonephila clavipes TaxID=2585209 RepID=A0A8X6W632_TRICX|nr:hypothetical protein TNCV_1970611 [Trichonephila clavipes]
MLEITVISCRKPVIEEARSLITERERVWLIPFFQQPNSSEIDSIDSEMVAEKEKVESDYIEVVELEKEVETKDPPAPVGNRLWMPRAVEKGSRIVNWRIR